MTKINEPKSEYQQAFDLVSTLELHKHTIIDMPENIVNFRKYLLELSKKVSKEFATKHLKVEGKLRVTRMA